ncbi:alpha/beta hydrolase (plasmid) [Streptomyces sp. BB1-1-1]|uniref:alpha/beta fold hydrolase n=1 Tax=Streptomyces sp. BB1-1-1 TaxID=3074430 RepID=UPI00287801AE|nr:alpha/beta hydrolase [Streptomyces sp. BB1-1-1]WND32835.1 alpha/beta hydrolase [Streptomyces sp. BB1-1-1]WND40097.1 alpha/beta hydrolase [Streptomyces sp. BB1-1-1]WND40929.1 alpha/beta hydrolase [Streptomyces sp. BB1-1-1]
MSYAEVNGLSLHFEEHGSGQPLILLHGGLGAGEMFAPLVPALSESRRVILVDLQGHGRTADIDRSLRPELMADDIVALIKHLGVEQADLLGYSTGADVALRVAIQHPHAVRRLVVVSTPCRRDGWHPEVVAAMDQMSSQAADTMKQSPIYELYSRLAPRPQDWPVLVGKMAELKHQDYDWSTEIPAITAPTLLVFGDADAIRPAHMVEFFALLGGGLRDAGFDGSGRSAAQLAVLPGASHYDILAHPRLAATVMPFLAS